MTTKDWFKAQLRKRNIVIRNYPFTVPARKQRLLDQLGIDLLVDVGANKGQAATSYRQHGYAGRILSLEPDPRAFHELVGAAAADERWDVTQTAVGDRPGSLELHLSDESQFNSLLPLTPTTTNASPASHSTSSTNVTVQTLDELLAGEQLDGLAVKIDVQGYEEQVLAGAQEVLRATKYIDIELCPVELYAGQILMLDLMRRMEAEGFALCALEDTYSDPRTGQVLAYNGVYARL